ncbi:GNAT family N-acetyltransferase [Streptomyces sp. NPDC102405]|uniref:GNAT family N-acetyltransferase n=1 Tax=Streptomyces sp. NPDC102405 TaxID=3366170 RepID=UPI0037F63DFB
MAGSEDTRMIIAPGEQAGRSFGAAKTGRHSSAERTPLVDQRAREWSSEETPLGCACPAAPVASWLGARFQRQGIGTEMRAAVLHLAFVGLNALEAMSGAFEDNASSFTVSMKHGYELDGVERHVVRGQPAIMRRLRLISGAG